MIRSASLTLVLIVLSSQAMAQTENGPPLTLDNIPSHAFFWTVMAASVVGWVLGKTKGFSTSGDWLEKYWPSPPLIAVLILDGIIFVVVGAYIGTGIYNPATFVAALAAGISWPVGIGALTTKVGDGS